MIISLNFTTTTTTIYQYTDDVLPELAQSGVRNLVVVPISFVSEHIETLEEIDLEYRELAESSGITNWRRCPALNTDPDFIDDMADMVVDALQVRSGRRGGVLGYVHEGQTVLSRSHVFLLPTADNSGTGPDCDRGVRF